MDNYSRNFIALVKIFNKHPYMFMNFLNKSDAFNETFKKRLAKVVLKSKPHFTDIEKMLDYYLHIMDADDTSVKDKVTLWNTKLYNAISEQRFEDAAKIRDYMNKRKYKILI